MLLIPLPFLLLAAVTDLKSRRIPNGITYPLLAVGLATKVLGGPGALAGVMGALALLFILGGRYGAVRLGGGDTKLLLGCLLFLPLEAAGVFLLLAVLISALTAMALTLQARGGAHLMGLLKQDLLTAGAAPAEAVHLPGAPVLLSAYGLVLAVLALKGGA